MKGEIFRDTDRESYKASEFSTNSGVLHRAGVEKYCDEVTETSGIDYRGNKAWVLEVDPVLRVVRQIKTVKPMGKKEALNPTD